MQSLKNEPNVDFSNPLKPLGIMNNVTENPDGTKNHDGTPINKKTYTSDIYNAMINAVLQAGDVPNKMPETPTDSQFIDSLFTLFGNVGAIVQMVGIPLPNARLLRLDGSLIDISEEKYKYLRKFIEMSKINSPQVFVDNSTADPISDRFKFKIDSNDVKKIWLPNPKTGDALRQFDIFDANTLGVSDNGSGGGVGEHEHEIEPFSLTIPAHTHGVNQSGWRESSQDWWENPHEAKVYLSFDKAIAPIQPTAGETIKGLMTIKTILPTKKVANSNDNIGAGGNIAFYIKY